MVGCNFLVFNYVKLIFFFFKKRKKVKDNETVKRCVKCWDERVKHFAERINLKLADAFA